MKINPPIPESGGTKLIPDDPNKEIKAILAQFLLSLIQAFLRTGYYTPDHPESKNAKVGLYEDFQNLLSEKNELTFLLRDVPGGKSILIEGVLSEAQELDSIMLKGMAEMYTPKFAKFLERKDLVSFTLKGRITWTEFNNFVDLMGEPTFQDTQEKSDKERFVQALKERGISHISYIFNEELPAVERGIPWRSQIALARLKKDFNTIPLFQNLDAEGLKEIRIQIIQDVVRPMHSPDVVYPILLNSDLAETEEFKESEIDKEMIACLSDELLSQISDILLKEVAGQKETELPHEKSVRLANQIASSLNLRGLIEREEIIIEYYKHKLITLEALPETIRRRIKRENNINKFLLNSDIYLKNFDNIDDKKKYVQWAKFFKSIIYELIHRNRYKEILKIVTLIDRHANEKKELSIYSEQILDEISEGKTLEALKGRFMSGQKEICLEIAPIFLKLKKRSVPHLLFLLKESSDFLVQKTACDILIQIDPSAINILLNELNREGIRTELIVRIIRILGEIECDEWSQPLVDVLQAYLNQENPRLREEALWVYYKIMGAKGEKLYLALLDDPDISIQKRAIQCLGKMKSEIALENFFEMLKGLEDEPLDLDPQIIPSIFSALAFYGNVEWPDKGSLEDFLLKTLDRQLTTGPFKFLKKKKDPQSESAVAAICETLGKIGTDKSCAILQKLEKQQDSLSKKKAEEALVKIAERKNARNGSVN